MTMTTANDNVCVKTKIFVCMVYGWIDVWLVGWFGLVFFFLVWLAYMVCVCMMHICTKMMIVFRVSSHQETLHDDHDDDCEEDDDGVFRFSFHHFLFLIFVHHHRITKKKKKPLHRKQCGLCESKFFYFLLWLIIVVRSFVFFSLVYLSKSTIVKKMF